MWNYYLNILLSVFKSIYNQLSSYNKECASFSSVNPFRKENQPFLLGLKNQPVVGTLSKRNGIGKAISISCFDLSTLYTKIPYWKFLMNCFF